jgi:hypothetical protein
MGSDGRWMASGVWNVIVDSMSYSRVKLELIHAHCWLASIRCFALFAVSHAENVEQ